MGFQNGNEEKRTNKKMASLLLSLESVANGNCTDLVQFELTYTIVSGIRVLVYNNYVELWNSYWLSFHLVISLCNDRTLLLIQPGKLLFQQICAFLDFFHTFT